MFCDNLMEWKQAKPVDRLICNAAVYQPSLDYAKWSVDGHEQQMQINYLSHFLMVSLLLEDLSRAPDPRVIMVDSVTGPGGRVLTIQLFRTSSTRSTKKPPGASRHHGPVR